LLFYDNIDNEVPAGVVCARGVCVLIDDDNLEAENAQDTLEKFRSAKKYSYLAPRLTLAFASILYGTNFPLGTLMNDSLPASATTSSRMLLASIVLSPFMLKLKPEMIKQALLCGVFTAMGYICQSAALMDTPPATVAFLGAVTVIVCPAFDAIIDGKNMSLKNSPQTYLAGLLCIAGVGVIEIDPFSAGNAADMTTNASGNILAILQGVGFGISFQLTEKLMRGSPSMALPVTAVQLSVTALIAALWCFSTESASELSNYGLLELFTNPDLRTTLFAVLWTGLITTAGNRVLETKALGKMGASEASVILASEPIWAAVFAYVIVNAPFGSNDIVGGALLVSACLCNTLRKDKFPSFITGED